MIKIIVILLLTLTSITDIFAGVTKEIYRGDGQGNLYFWEGSGGVPDCMGFSNQCWVKYVVTELVVKPNPNGSGYQVDFDFATNEINANQNPNGSWNQYVGATNSYTFPAGYGGTFTISSGEFPGVPAMTIDLVGHSTDSNGHCTFIVP